MSILASMIEPLAHVFKAPPSGLIELVKWAFHDPRDPLYFFINSLGSMTYVLLFAVIFCETGLVILPILPGDSLLFAAGVLSAQGMGLNIVILIPLLIFAAIIGDSVNYFIGTLLGPRLAAKGKLPLIKQKHLDATHRFYEK